MPLVFAAITPHPPILIEQIGKDKIEKIKKTQDAILLLEQELYLTKPNVIMIISPHGSIFEDAFSVNADVHFDSAFEEFGDLATKDEWNGIPGIAAKISHESNPRGIPVQLISEPRLDHGSTVPLHYLTRHLPEIKILPIGYSGLDSKKHLEFGELLKDVIMESDKRIALIASADLSHTLSEESPAGFHSDGAEFDKQIISLLETRNTKGVAGLDPVFVQHAAACGYRSILLALGILKNMNYTFKNYGYEAPFGVGYLTGHFVF
jgi:aromatic ring-opening dioxygenase LigB subunit